MFIRLSNGFEPSPFLSWRGRHAKGWFTLDAAVCVFLSGLCQCRDRKFSIFLWKCNRLPQMNTENAVLWMGLKKFVIVRTLSFFGLNGPILLFVHFLVSCYREKVNLHRHLLWGILSSYLDAFTSQRVEFDLHKSRLPMVWYFELLKMGQSWPLFCLFWCFHLTKFKYKLTMMVCMGIEPGAANWKVQMKPLK